MAATVQRHSRTVMRACAAIPVFADVAVHAHHLIAAWVSLLLQQSIKTVSAVKANFFSVRASAAVDVVERQKKDFCFSTANTLTATVSSENSIAQIRYSLLVVSALVRKVFIRPKFAVRLYPTLLWFSGLSELFSVRRDFFSPWPGVVRIPLLELFSLLGAVASHALVSPVKSRLTPVKRFNRERHLAGFAGARGFMFHGRIVRAILV
jgi:hypothetical protein